MALHLSIENEARACRTADRLAYSRRRQRGIDIGRDQHLDWTLPDPTRIISGKHCEIRYHDGAYWLHDVSTQRHVRERQRPAHAGAAPAAQRRPAGDRPLHHRGGDRRRGGAAPAARRAARPRSYGSAELWGRPDEAAPPIHPPRPAAAPRQRPVQPDFLDWAVDVPDAQPAIEPRRRRRARPRSRARRHGLGAGPRPPAPLRRSQPIAVRAAAAPAARAAPRPLDYAPAAPMRQPAPYPARCRLARGRRRPLSRRRRPAARDRGRAARAAAPPPPAEPPPAPPRRRRSCCAASPGAPACRRISSPAAIRARSPKQLGAPHAARRREPQAAPRRARRDRKRLTRSSNQTMVQALDNNPLKFSPTPEDALRIMFGPRDERLSRCAPDAASRASTTSRRISSKTYAAMQHALRRCWSRISIRRRSSEATGAGQGLGALVGSRKAKLWDAYVARWEAQDLARRAPG